MDKAPQKMLKIMKVEQNLGKKIPMEDLTYQTLIDKLILAFKININHQYYHLYYYDEKQRKITINSPEDYQIFTQSQYQKKLFICKTSKSILSMTNYKSNKEQIQEQISIQKAVYETKKRLQERLIEFRIKLRQKAKTMLNESISDLIKRYLQKDPYQTIHQNQKCKKCKSNQSIKGTLYKCSVCELTLCHICQQFIQHPHPFYKIVTNTQKMPKRQYYLASDSHQILVAKQIRNTSLAEQFAGMVGCNPANARELITRYPKASIKELIQIFFDDVKTN